MTFAPLSEVRDNLKPQWYRSKMTPETFRTFSKRSDYKGFIQAGGHFGLFCITGISLCFLWLYSYWIAFCLTLFIHGTISSFLRGRLFMNLGMARSLKQNGSISFFYTCSASSVGGTLLITQQVTPTTTATPYTQRETERYFYPYTQM